MMDVTNNDKKYEVTTTSTINTKHQNTKTPMTYFHSHHSSPNIPPNKMAKIAVMCINF
jgi:hypothetical protein